MEKLTYFSTSNNFIFYYEFELIVDYYLIKGAYVIAYVIEYVITYDYMFYCMRLNMLLHVVA